MAQHGKDTVVLHNQYNITSSLDSTSIDRTIAVLDTSVFGQDSRTYTPGQKDGTISVEGFADPAAVGIDSILSGTFGSTATYVTVSLGQTAGSNAYLIDSIENQYTTTSSVTDLVRISGEYQTAQDGICAGVLLLPVTTATTTATGASYDRSAVEITGSVGYCHVTAASGTSPTLDVSIQIDDNSGFTSPTTLLTFSQVGPINVMRIESTTTVVAADQYVRAAYTLGGTDPSFTFAVAWAPR